MLDDGVGLERRKPQRRTAAERAAIVAETYKPGAQRLQVLHGDMVLWRLNYRGGVRR